MALSIQLGYPNVPRSITNPTVNSKDAIDVGYPMSFLEFIKYINISLEPETLQTYYNSYISSWNSLINSNETSTKSLIVEKYRNFLKDIILHHSTMEEKQFLSSMDFTDPLDLDIALGFYSKKLKDLCSFYNNKREETKYGVLRKKMEGSDFGTKNTIQNLILSYVKNIDDSKMIFDIDSIISNMEVEIEELYDTYPLYYNQPSDEKVYDKKDLDYGLNIFLKDDEELINEVFSTASEDIKKLKEVDQLFENKRQLTQKYISTDFYFLSTGSTVTNVVSGKLFDSKNTILNFLNRSYPTTASTSLDLFQTPRERGFFRPTNVSFVLINGSNLSYTVDKTKLEPFSLYFFPDPNISGGETDILKFTINDSGLKRNTTSGNASNQPYSVPSDTNYYGYHSKIDPNNKKYFDSLFNSGYIQDYKQDLYNNSYALFKSGFESYITDSDSTDSTTYNTIINGYLFYDNLYWEGFGFNYTTIDSLTFNETKRTGLSSNTSGFSIIEPDVTLRFGYFLPYYSLTAPTDENLVQKYRYIDGALLTQRDLSLLSDPTSSDLSAFELDPSTFYYSKLIEGGIYSQTQRALLDSGYPSLTANFSDYNRLSTFTVDGGSFNDIFEYTQTTNNSLYIDSNINNTELYPISAFTEFDGGLFVKNSNSKNIYHILDTFSHLTTTYPYDVVSQLTEIQKFEVIYDILSIETKNYILFEHINYINGEFKPSKTPTPYNIHSTTPYDKISNRIKSGNNVLFCILHSEGNSYDNTLKIIPYIYSFNIVDKRTTQIFPTPSSDLEYFTIPESDVIYVKSDQPVISYSSRNNIFNLSFLLKDQNNYPSVISYDFMLSPDVVFISSKQVFLTTQIMSNAFNLSIPNNLNVFLSASPILLQEDALII